MSDNIGLALILQQCGDGPILVYCMQLRLDFIESIELSAVRTPLII